MALASARSIRVPARSRGRATKRRRRASGRTTRRSRSAARNEDRAERDAQDRFGIFVDRAVNIAERGNVVMRCCFGHHRAPSMVLSLACAFTGDRWAKAAALDDSLEDELIGDGGRCKEPCGGTRRKLPQRKTETPDALRPAWCATKGQGVVPRAAARACTSVRVRTSRARC